MSLLGRVTAAAGALALAAAVVFVALRWSGDRGESPRAAAGSDTSAAAAESLPVVPSPGLARVPVAEGQAAATAPESAAERPAPDAAADSEPIPGWLVAGEDAGLVWGKVLSWDGAPLAGHSLGFETEDSARDGTTTGLDGSYRIRLPPGTYRVLYSGADSDDQCAVITGHISLEARAELEHHILLAGDRILTGRLRMRLFPEQSEREVDEMSMQLELRRGSYPHELVAVGFTTAPDHGSADPSAYVAATEPPPPGRDALTAPPEKPEQEREPAAVGPTPGSFRFAGLVPDHYKLRIIVGEDAEGRAIYDDREVDLFAGDVELPPEELDLGAIVEAHLGRMQDR